MADRPNETGIFSHLLIRKMSREKPLWGAPRIHGELLLVLAHDRRRILHCGVTAHPAAEWAAQQPGEAFPWDTAPRYLLRDRDRIFGDDFTNDHVVVFNEASLGRKLLNYLSYSQRSRTHLSLARWSPPLLRAPGRLRLTGPRPGREPHRGAKRYSGLH